jgi:hypothetical protein
VLAARTDGNLNHEFAILWISVQVLEKKSGEYYVHPGKAKYSRRKTGWPLKYASGKIEASHLHSVIVRLSSVPGKVRVCQQT